MELIFRQHFYETIRSFCSIFIKKITVQKHNKFIEDVENSGIVSTPKTTINYSILEQQVVDLFLAATVCLKLYKGYLISV